MTQRLLDTKQAAEYLGLEVKTLEAWRYQGRGPKSLHLGRAVRYDLQDLDAYIESLKQAS